MFSYIIYKLILGIAKILIKYILKYIYNFLHYFKLIDNIFINYCIIKYNTKFT